MSSQRIESLYLLSFWESFRPSSCSLHNELKLSTPKPEKKKKQENQWEKQGLKILPFFKEDFVIHKRNPEGFTLYLRGGSWFSSTSLDSAGLSSGLDSAGLLSGFASVEAIINFRKARERESEKENCGGNA